MARTVAPPAEQDSKQKVAFVTGATGFVALNLIDALLAKGWIVYALHRPGSSRARLFLDLPHYSEKKLLSVAGDLSYEEQDFIPLVPPETDVIYHIALMRGDPKNMHPGRKGTMANVGFVPECQEIVAKLNLHGLQNVIASAKKHSIRRVIFCSTWSSYGVLPEGTMVTESTPSTAKERTVRTGLLSSADWGPWKGRHQASYHYMKYRCEEVLTAAQQDGTINEAVIIQPCSIFGRYGDAAWSSIFFRLQKANGNLPGFPGSSSFCDVEDLADAFVAAATAGPGESEKYIIGGTNEKSITMQKIMAEMVGVPFSGKPLDPGYMRLISRWNEFLLPFKWLWFLRIQAAKIHTPTGVEKMCQDQGTESLAAIKVLGYRTRPLREMLQRNFDWLIASGKLVVDTPKEDSISKKTD